MMNRVLEMANNQKTISLMLAGWLASFGAAAIALIIFRIIFSQFDFPQKSGTNIIWTMHILIQGIIGGIIMLTSNFIYGLFNEKLKWSEWEIASYFMIIGFIFGFTFIFYDKIIDPIFSLQFKAVEIYAALLVGAMCGIAFSLLRIKWRA